MKQFDLSGYNLQTKIYLCLILFLSVAAIGFASFKSFSFSISQLAVLAVSLAVSILVNLQSFKIRKTNAKFPAREIIAFWGTIWLGIPGGILLGAASAIAKYPNFPKDKKRWLFECGVSIVSITSASIIFYLFLNRAAGFAETPVADKEIGFGWLAAAVVVMALMQYAASALLNLIFRRLETNPIFWKEDFVSAGVKYLLAIGGVMLFHFSFLKFGLWFGLVILPTVILAHLAYRMHVKSLARETIQTIEANRIHVATVEALATAIDARDQVGIGHVRRTQIYAVGMGMILRLSEDEIEALRTGALLHDIGKLAVPDHILNKPGRLTPAEMEKMKIHAAVGASILGKVNFPYPVVPTVQHHHEMWDGSGYPQGLKQEDIPLTARVLAIADAYDTLRGARPYRAAVSREEARRFLLNGAGTHFDPKLIDVFLRNLREFENEIDAQGLSYSLDGEVEEDLFSSIEPNADNANQGYVTQIKRANREVFALYELARIFSSSLNLEETLALFVKKIGELVPFDSCVVYLLDKSQETAQAVHAEGKNAADLKNRRVKSGEGATGYVLKKRQAVYNINPALDFSFYQLDFIQDYRAMASLPLITEENLVGAVSLYSCDLENYEDEHMRLLETVSRIAADAIFKSVRHADAESRALTDPMTGLPNARSLQLQFETEVARARRNGSQFQVLMIDLDGFKAVNDTFGHKTGDLLLKEISKVMRGQLRDYDFLARYAGDEFVVIAPETDEKAAQELCERMEAAVLGFALPVDEGKSAKVGVSLGAAGFPNQGETLDQVIIAADKAMYAVKAKHRQNTNPAPAAPPVSTPAEKVVEVPEDMVLVELDESHIVSSAIN
ncbi:MAG: diguanylate cyclase [Pyrinomonadaceae bacterium]